MKKLKKEEMMEELVYPIAINYGEQLWDIPSAIREFVTNAKDTLGKNQFKYDTNTKMAKVIDFGTGLTQTSFVFGESTRGKNQIGQFGEGIKMALLTTLRLKRKCFIKTVGFDVEVSKKKAYGTEVMKLKFKKNDKTIGTEVYIECSEEEFKKSQELFLDIVQPEKLGDCIYKDGGKIYILGLLTSKMDNMLFSYNILDKSMTNRDRNIVAADKLNNNISSLLENTNSKEVIKEFLSNIESSNAYEYQLVITPKHKKIWKKILEEIYGEKIVLSAYPEHDLKAMTMGYKVINNISNNVKNILSHDLKIESSISIEYNGEGFQKNNKTIYPISKKYIEDWTSTKAIGELMANAIDTRVEHTFEYNNNYGYIIDQGKGITKKNLIIGDSAKDSNQIGNFGEGLKMALLVLTKEKNTNVTIATVGHTYKALFEYDSDFDAELFSIYEEPNNKKIGTEIFFKCINEDFEKAKKLFLDLDTNKILYEDEDIQVFNRIRDDSSNKNKFFGYFYVNGYKITERKALYSYNIKNKDALFGRDRNAVNMNKAEFYIQEFFNKTENENIIKDILNLWGENIYRNCLEYNLNRINPKDIKFWKKIFRSNHSKVCLGANSNENLVAEKVGYKVLSNYPSVMERLFKKMCIRSASIIYDKNKDKGFSSENKIIYPIQSSYSLLSISKATQELISNAFDTKTNVFIKRLQNGLVTIEDKGKGFSQKSLLLGNSKKKSTNSIGKFGEGLKLAALAFAKANKIFKIETQNMVYEAKIEKSIQYNTKVLVFNVVKLDRKREGTKITIEVNEEELKCAKDNFLIYSDMEIKGLNIYNPGKKVFVNGVFICDLNSIFSYNLKDTQDLLNRDRNSIVDMDELKNQIKYKIEFLDNKDVIKTLFLDKNKNNLEHSLDIIIPQVTKFLWTQVMNDVFKKCCIPMNNEYDVLAKDEGYTLLADISDMQKRILLQLGMEYSKNIVSNSHDNAKKIISEKDLTMDQILRWNKAKKIFGKIYGEEIKYFKIVSDFESNLNTISDEKTLGMYIQGEDTLYILLNLLNQEEFKFSDLLGTMVHEYLHKKSGASDRTREFENALTHEIGMLLNLVSKDVPPFFVR